MSAILAADRKKVNALLNDAEIVEEDQQKHEYLCLAQDILLKKHDARLIAEFYQRILAFHKVQMPHVRRFVIEFIGTSARLHRYRHLATMFPTLGEMASDRHPLVVKAMITVMRVLYRPVLRTLCHAQSWNQKAQHSWQVLQAIKRMITDVHTIQAGDDSVRSHAYKFMEYIIMTYTSTTLPHVATSSSGSGDGGHDAGGEDLVYFSTTHHVPPQHPVIKTGTLHAEANELFGRLVGTCTPHNRPQHLSACNLTVILTSLGIIARQRLSYCERVATTLQNFSPPASMHQRRIRRVNHCLKVQMLLLLRHQPAGLVWSTYHERMTAMGYADDVAKVRREQQQLQRQHPQVGKRGSTGGHDAAGDGSYGIGAKRQRTAGGGGGTSSSAAGGSSTSSSSTSSTAPSSSYPMPSANINDPGFQTLLHRLGALPVHLIADLVVKSMENFHPPQQLLQSTEVSSDFIEFLARFAQGGSSSSSTGGATGTGATSASASSVAPGAAASLSAAADAAAALPSAENTAAAHARKSQLPAIPIPQLSSDLCHRLSRQAFNRIISVQVEQAADAAGESDLRSHILVKLATWDEWKTGDTDVALLQHILEDFPRRSELAHRWLYALEAQHVAGRSEKLRLQRQRRRQQQATMGRGESRTTGGVKQGSATTTGATHGNGVVVIGDGDGGGDDDDAQAVKNKLLQAEAEIAAAEAALSGATSTAEATTAPATTTTTTTATESVVGKGAAGISETEGKKGESDTTTSTTIKVKLEGSSSSGSSSSSAMDVDQEQAEDGQEGKEDQDEEDQEDDVYASVLYEIINELERLLEPNDALFTSFLMEVPRLTNGVYEVIARYCRQPSRVKMGLSTLRDLIQHRPPERDRSLLMLLEYAHDETDLLREYAIRLITQILFSHIDLQDHIETYAVNLLSLTLKSDFLAHLPVIPAELPADWNKSEEEKEQKKKMEQEAADGAAAAGTGDGDGDGDQEMKPADGKAEGDAAGDADGDGGAGTDTTTQAKEVSSQSHFGVGIVGDDDDETGMAPEESEAERAAAAAAEEEKKKSMSKEELTQYLYLKRKEEELRKAEKERYALEQLQRDAKRRQKESLKQQMAEAERNTKALQRQVAEVRQKAEHEQRQKERLHYVSRHLMLYFALCTKKPSMLQGIMKVYARAEQFLRFCIHKLAPELIMTLGAHSPALLQVIRQHHKASASFILHILHTLTKESLPSPQLVQVVRQLDDKLQDARYLIPILNGIPHDYLLRILPRIVQLPTQYLKAAITKMCTAKGMAVMPAQVMVEVHLLDLIARVDQKTGQRTPVVPLKKIIEATQICFEQRDIFTQDVLVVVLQQLSDKKPTPKLMIRTLIQTLKIYPALVQFAMGVLSRLIVLAVWQNKILWEGFMKCCVMTRPHSFPILLQLPPTQFRDVMARYDPIRRGIIAFVRDNPNACNRHLMPVLQDAMAAAAAAASTTPTTTAAAAAGKAPTTTTATAPGAPTPAPGAPPSGTAAASATTPSMPSSASPPPSGK